ncbi:MAG: transcription elongation factor GreA [Selenomonadaceae bacterium]|nr:transcription elongation factor GreA [Selenomonadaceae bacterium]
MAQKTTVLTQDGYDKLVEKLNYLKSVKRLEVADRLKVAISLGDLSENSEYDDAKNEQGRLEAEIRELEAKLNNSDIIRGVSIGDTVSIGSKVKIREVESGEEDTYMIVGSTETDPDNGKISNESPIGAALIGHSAGAIVQVHAPIGVVEYELVEILRN